MQSWLIFWNTMFWLSLFLFFLNSNNLLSLLLYSEIVWVILYVLSVCLGSLNDDINLNKILASIVFLILNYDDDIYNILHTFSGWLLCIFFYSNHSQRHRAPYHAQSPGFKRNDIHWIITTLSLLATHTGFYAAKKDDFCHSHHPCPLIILILSSSSSSHHPHPCPVSEHLLQHLIHKNKKTHYK